MGFILSSLAEFLDRLVRLSNIAISHFSTRLIRKVSFDLKLFLLKFSPEIFFKRPSHRRFLRIRDVVQAFFFWVDWVFVSMAERRHNKEFLWSLFVCHLTGGALAKGRVHCALALSNRKSASADHASLFQGRRVRRCLNRPG